MMYDVTYRLGELASRDEFVLKVSIAKNELETYIYTTRMNLFEEIVEWISTEGQRQELNEELDKAEEWLYDQSNVCA